MMKRRLVIASVTAALLAGGAGAASAATDERSDPRVPGHQLCLLLYGDRGGIPDKLCLNW